MSEDSIDIGFVDGPRQSSNGAIKRRVVLRVGGEDIDVLTLRLDSDQSRQRQAKRWAETFELDAGVLEGKLRRAALEATNELQQNRGDDPPREGKLPPPTPLTLTAAKEVFAKWIKLDDWTILDVVLGTVIVHRLDGDPLWMLVVGPPGAIKTEILRTLSSHPDVKAVSTLSPTALISGYITDGPDPSLLPKLDGKVLIVKDFTAILQMQRDARQEVISMLRDCYDGEACRAFGTGEVKSYRSRFGFIAAVTPAIDNYGSVNAMLGERYLRFRLRTGDTLDKIDKALGNTASEGIMRTELAEAALGVLAQNPGTPHLPDDIAIQIRHLANLVATARSEVSRDSTGTVTFVPVPEVGTRVVKQLKKLALGVAMVRGIDAVDSDVYRIVVRVGRDTLPSMRERLLRDLWGTREVFQVTADIADRCEVDTDTARRWLADLRLLGIVDRFAGSRNAHEWRLCDTFVKDALVAEVWQERDDVTSGGMGGATPIPTVNRQNVPPMTQNVPQTRQNVRW